MAFYNATFVFVFLISAVFGGRLYMNVDPSPVKTTVGNSLTLNCNIGGYGINVSPTFVRWERRTSNSGEFHKITRNLEVLAGLDGISISLIPGGFTYRYPLTFKSFRTADVGSYKCVASGPLESHDVVSSIVNVVV